MHSPPKKVLIVDDSRVMRAWLRTVLTSDARLVVVGEAEDALKARDFLRANPADVVTLDIEMPGMSGLEFLTRLMRAHPMPVVMMSSLTAAGSEAAVQALSHGAVDCMVKPSKAYGPELTLSICETVFNAACTRPSQLKRRAKTEVPAVPKQALIERPCEQGTIILIGASTGGVAALEAVLPELDANGPPVVVVQHMPGNFLVSFTERLSRNLPQNVVLAHDGLELKRGDIVVAPGNGKHTQIRRRNNIWRCEFAENDPPSLHCPSVDSLFISAVSEAKYVNAAILTGLGRDGAESLLQLEQSGASTFGQNEDTCVVYGMPRAANAIGAVQSELALEKIGPALRDAGNRRKRMRKSVGGSGAQ